MPRWTCRKQRDFEIFCEHLSKCNWESVTLMLRADTFRVRWVMHESSSANPIAVALNLDPDVPDEVLRLMQERGAIVNASVAREELHLTPFWGIKLCPARVRRLLDLGARPDASGYINSIFENRLRWMNSNDEESIMQTKAVLGLMVAYGARVSRQCIRSLAESYKSCWHPEFRKGRFAEFLGRIEILMVLCSALQLPRVAVKSPLSVLPMDLIRYLARMGIGL